MLRGEDKKVIFFDSLIFNLILLCINSYTKSRFRLCGRYRRMTNETQLTTNKT